LFITSVIIILMMTAEVLRETSLYSPFDNLKCLPICKYFTGFSEIFWNRIICPCFYRYYFCFYIPHQLCSTLIAWCFKTVYITSFITFLYLPSQHPSTFVFILYHGIKIQRLLYENFYRFYFGSILVHKFNDLFLLPLGHGYVTVHILILPQSAVNTNFVISPNVQLFCQYKAC
jgi:hypothetical protein